MTIKIGSIVRFVPEKERPQQRYKVLHIERRGHNKLVTAQIYPAPHDVKMLRIWQRQRTSRMLHWELAT